MNVVELVYKKSVTIYLEHSLPVQLLWTVALLVLSVMFFASVFAGIGLVDRLWMWTVGATLLTVGTLLISAYMFGEGSEETY